LTKKTLKILGVDDSKDITEALEMTFERLGHDFSSTNSGKEAVELIKNNSYDIILLDLAMPGFSGLDVINELQTMPNLKDLNIILFSASTFNDSETEEFYKKGVCGIIIKPVDVSTLEAEIKKILATR